MNKYFLSLFLLLAAAPLSAQDVEMATGLYSSGKIYVVVGVLLLIVAGMIAYLFYLDRKMSRMEKEFNARKK